ncbi:MAG: alpha/beta hydrolase, partial [Thermoanaerobaculia bacterium]
QTAAEDRGMVELHGVAQWPSPSQRWSPDCRPAIVLCHGFKGFMDWGFHPPLADLLVERGFAVIRFNFSSSGMRPGDDLVTDVEGFRRGTYSQDRAEVLRILAAVGTEIACGHADPGHVGLLGHSRGGGAALQAAAHPDWRERLQALVTWAAVSTYDRFGDAVKETWRREGAIPIVNGRTGQEVPFGVEVLEDFETHRQELDLHRAAGRRRAPWLIVHGSGDETVPVTEAEDLDRQAADPRQLHVVADAGHTFGASHPFAGPTPHLTEAMNVSQTWLRRHLCS